MGEPGDFGTCTLDHDGCLTCGDVGVPVKVIAVEGNCAVCEDRVGQRTEVAVDLVDRVQPGDVVIAHAGVAIAKVEALA
jgi:hydrogenase expression/formation protein HypC